MASFFLEIWKIRQDLKKNAVDIFSKILRKKKILIKKGKKIWKKMPLILKKEKGKIWKKMPLKSDYYTSSIFWAYKLR